MHKNARKKSGFKLEKCLTFYPKDITVQNKVG